MAAAIALVVADERAAGQVYNVAEGEAPTEVEWVARIGAAVGWSGRIVVVPADRLPSRHDLDYRNHLAVSDRRIRAELGYVEIVSPSEGLRRTIAWERANPPAKVDPADFDYAAEDAILAK